jgi:hypothetical protein
MIHIHPLCFSSQALYAVVGTDCMRRHYRVDPECPAHPCRPPCQARLRHRRRQVVRPDPAIVCTHTAEHTACSPAHLSLFHLCPVHQPVPWHRPCPLVLVGRPALRLVSRCPSVLLGPVYIIEHCWFLPVFFFTFGPAAPGAPFAPAGPGGPGCPAAPDFAASACGPGAPLGPFGPAGPGSPAVAAGHSLQVDSPHGLYEPGGPSAPGLPSSPAAPSLPSLPSPPAGPAGPGAPCWHVQPIRRCTNYGVDAGVY